MHLAVVGVMVVVLVMVMVMVEVEVEVTAMIVIGVTVMIVIEVIVMSMIEVIVMTLVTTTATINGTATAMSVFLVLGHACLDSRSQSQTWLLDPSSRGSLRPGPPENHQKQEDKQRSQ